MNLCEAVLQEQQRFGCWCSHVFSKEEKEQ
jgi:hypothetical protein